MDRTMFAALAAAVISLGTGNQAAAEPPTDPNCFGQAVSSFAQTNASVLGRTFGQIVSRAARGGDTVICNTPGRR